MKFMIKEKFLSLISKILGGVSSAKFDSYTRKIKINGWFLGPGKFDKIFVYYGDNIILGPAKLNQPRLDVYEKYPRYDNRNSGFSFEATINEPIDFSNNLPVYIKIFSKDILIHTFKSKLSIDDTLKNCFEELLKNNTVYINCIPKTSIDPEKIYPLELGCEIEKIDVDFLDYRQWLARVNYEKNYPKYVKEFPVGELLNRKSLQHYLSIKLFEIDTNKNGAGIYLDVASSNSAFPDILTAEYKIEKVYRQDWLYKKGIHGSRIGSNAVAVPLPDHSIDKITLHCSWEHFEENLDVEFFKEAHRLLKEKGKLCIIPLYLAEEYFAITSPGIWQQKYSRVTTVPPKFEKGMIVCIMEQVMQRQQKFYNPKVLSEKVLQPYKDLFDFKILHFANHKEHSGCPVYALNAAAK